MIFIFIIISIIWSYYGYSKYDEIYKEFSHDHAVFLPKNGKMLWKVILFLNLILLVACICL